MGTESRLVRHLRMLFFPESFGLINARLNRENIRIRRKSIGIPDLNDAGLPSTKTIQAERDFCLGLIKASHFSETNFNTTEAFAIHLYEIFNQPKTNKKEKE